MEVMPNMPRAVEGAMPAMMATNAMPAIPLAPTDGMSISNPVAQIPLQAMTPKIIATIEDAVRTAEKTTAEQQLNSPNVAAALLQHVKRCFTDAENARNTNSIVPGRTITQMLIESQDRMDGQHTNPKILKAISENKVPNFYEPLTVQFVRDALAWWHDATVSFGSDWWTGNATPAPQMPDGAENMIRDRVKQSIAQAMAANPELIVSKEDYDKAVENDINLQKEDLKARADDRSKSMVELVKDQLVDSDFLNIRDEFRLNQVGLGTSFYWGPYPKPVRMPQWDENGKRKVEVISKAWVEVVHPLDIFPAPWITETWDHGYVIRRMKIMPGELQNFVGIPNSGWRDEEINALIRQQESNTGAIREVIQGDEQKARVEGKDQVTDPRGDFRWFIGFISGAKLKGFGAEFADENKDYHVHVKWMGDHLLQVIANWWDMQEPICHKAVWRKKSNSFWGVPMPMDVRFAQDEANAVQLAKLDNMSRAAAGITTVEQHRIINKADIGNGAAGTILLVSEAEIPTMMPPVQHIQIPMLSGQFDSMLAGIYTKAEEQSGVRKYNLGSDKVAGAGRTSSGLVNLMNASSKTLTFGMYQGDKAEARMLRVFVDFNNTFGADEVKGDINIVTQGASGFFMQEVQMKQLGVAINQLLNPALLEFPGVKEQLLTLVREEFKTMRINHRYLPTDDDIKGIVEQYEQKMMMAGMAGAGGAASPQNNGQGGANNAGTPAQPEE